MSAEAVPIIVFVLATLPLFGIKTAMELLPHVDVPQVRPFRHVLQSMLPKWDVYHAAVRHCIWARNAGETSLLYGKHNEVGETQRRGSLVAPPNRRVSRDRKPCRCAWHGRSWGSTCIARPTTGSPPPNPPKCRLLQPHQRQGCAIGVGSFFLPCSRGSSDTPRRSSYRSKAARTSGASFRRSNSSLSFTTPSSVLAP